MSRLARSFSRGAVSSRAGRLAKRATVWLLVAERRPPPAASDDQRLDAAVGWLRRAQDEGGGGGGVAAAFDLASGWQPPYQETSGYIVGTLLHHAALRDDDESGRRAVEIGDWLVSQQRADGSWGGGPHMTDGGSYVFDTGQILLGLVALAEVVGDPRYAAPAERAAAWLAAAQDDDGCWRTHTVSDRPHAYDARVAWALARAGAVLGDRRWTAAAARAADWIQAQQRHNAWIGHMAFEAGDQPLTHTIGYTIEGLLEYAVVRDTVGGPAWETATKALAALRRAYDERDSGVRLRRGNRLAGTIRSDWTSTDRWSCVTGSLQLGLCAHRVAKVTATPRWVDFGDRLIDSASPSQPLGRGAGAAEGGVPGSAPLWGPYGSFRYINWGTKFLVDALLARRGAGLPHIRLS